MAERWKPNNGEEYFYVNLLRAGSQSDTWTNHRVDKKLWENGNCFKTEAEAEAAAEKVEALLLSLHHGIATELLAKAGLVEWHKKFLSFLKETPPKNNLQDKTTSIQDKIDNIQDKSLPKLTAEVFSRPDCPKWAKYAALSGGGWLSFYEDKPRMSKDEYPKRWLNYDRWYPVEGAKFDATDWQNSLVERPAAKLPDWCKVGEWVYYRGYRKIIKVNALRLVLESAHCGDLTVYPEEIGKEVKQARLRPYNAEEIPDLPFEVTKKNSNFRTTVVSCRGNKVWLAVSTIAFSTEELMQDFTTKGEPCGVLEHLENGEWVK